MVDILAFAIAQYAEDRLFAGRAASLPAAEAEALLRDGRALRLPDGAADDAPKMADPGDEFSSLAGYVEREIISGPVPGVLGDVIAKLVTGWFPMPGRIPRAIDFMHGRHDIAELADYSDFAAVWHTPFYLEGSAATDREKAEVITWWRDRRACRTILELHRSIRAGDVELDGALVGAPPDRVRQPISADWWNTATRINWIDGVALAGGIEFRDIRLRRARNLPAERSRDSEVVDRGPPTVSLPQSGTSELSEAVLPLQKRRARPHQGKRGVTFEEGLLVGCLVAFRHEMGEAEFALMKAGQFSQRLLSLIGRLQISETEYLGRRTIEDHFRAIRAGKRNPGGCQWHLAARVLSDVLAEDGRGPSPRDAETWERLRSECLRRLKAEFGLSDDGELRALIDFFVGFVDEHLIPRVVRRRDHLQNLRRLRPT